MKTLLQCYAAGSLGALANSLTVWLFGFLGLTAWSGVSIAPALTPQWLYPRLVWGGIWGLLFVFPRIRAQPMRYAALLSLLPTLVQLFVVFPFKANKGVAGLDLGLLTPLFVIFFNLVWGWVTALSLRAIR